MDKNIKTLPHKKHKKYTCDDDFFSRDNPESFYWAGFIAADGFLIE